MPTLVTLVLAGCAPSGGSHHFVQVPVHRIEVLPSATAAPGEVLADRVDGERRPHVVTSPTLGLPSGELFVFLPGSGTSPIEYDWLASFAAFHGTPTLSLAYENGQSVEERCGEGTLPGCRGDDPTCDESVRLESLYGRSTHDSVCIDVPDEEALVHRLLRAVQYLAATYPEAGFGRHLSADGEALEWSTLAVGGWSQGGGHAGLLGRDVRLARAIYLSKGAGAVECRQLPPEQQARWACDPTLAEEDVETLEQAAAVAVPAPWVVAPRATPPEAEHGAVHASENAALYSFETFEAFGLLDDVGEVLDLDTYDGPLDGGPLAVARVVTTAATPACAPTDFHPSMAVDHCLALGDDGIPVVADAYSWFFAP